MTELYTYQVARIRCHELDLLTKADIDSLMACKDYETCLKVLKDKGFGEDNSKNVQEILKAENIKLWDFMKELLKDLSVFDVLLYPIDYNNLKASIKSSIHQNVPTGIFKDGGTINPEIFVQAVKENNFSKLPEQMGKNAKKAYDVFVKTRDGQLCDMILDKACLEAIKKAGENSTDDLIKEYAEIIVAISNIKIAVRCQKMHKNLDFIKDCLTDCKTLNVYLLAENCVKSFDDVIDYLEFTSYKELTGALSESNSAFEKACDNKIMALVQKQKYNPFTIGPLVAYVIARQTEMSAVKIILSGKQNELDDEMIKERLRDMYV